MTFCCRLLCWVTWERGREGEVTAVGEAEMRISFSFKLQRLLILFTEARRILDLVSCLRYRKRLVAKALLKIRVNNAFPHDYSIHEQLFRSYLSRFRACGSLFW